MGYTVLIQLRANDAKLADDGCTAHTNVMLLGNIVKVDPTTVSASNDALGTQDHTETAGIQAVKDSLQLGNGEFLCGFHTPRSKDFVSVMMMVVMTVTTAATFFVVVVVMMLVFVMIVTAAATLFVVVMMLVFVMIVTAAATFFVVVVVMLVFVVIVTAAATLFVIVVVMMLVFVMIVTAAATLIVVVMMLVFVMIVTAAATLFVIVVMMVFLFQLCQGSGQGSFALHSLQQLLTVQFIPGCNYQCCVGIPLTDQGNSGFQLVFCNGIGTGEDDRGCGFDLIVVEFAKVLHINLDLAGIRNSNGVAENDILVGDLFHSGNHIAELAHTGGFDYDALRGIFCDNLVERLAKIAHQTAADAAGVHFGDIDACILQKTTVNADFTEFVFNKNQLLTCIGFLNHFLDQRGFTRTQETGEYINFCHLKHLLYINL